MARHYLEVLSDTIRDNWNEIALADYRTLTRYTYGDLADNMANLGNIYDQLKLKKGVHVAICGNNCANWAVAYLGTAVWGGVNVCVMPDFQAEDIARIVNHSNAQVLIAAEPVRKKLEGHDLPKVKYIIALETLLPLNAKKIQAPEIHLTKDDVKYEGKSLDDLVMICYTSGSTGTPKGVMLSYRSLSNNVQNCMECLPEHNGQNVLSMLPLAHMYGLVCELLAQIPAGCHIWFLGQMPTPAVLKKALAEIRPYTIVTIPLVIEKLVKKNIMPVLKKKHINFLWHLPGINRLMKKMVCKTLNMGLGGNVRQFHVGGAALDEDVEKLLMDIKFPLTVGYGLTETGPLVSGNLWQNFKARSGGRVVSGMEAKIVDEEIWVRGENVMLGYYNEPALTKQVLTKDGWFRTGDVGKVEEDGTIYVQGHKSNLIVQADGNKVYPETIEAILNDMEGVDESLVTVWNNQLVAVVVTQMDLSVENMRNKLNEMLPSYSRITKIETQTDPLERTPKHSIKRYLYRDKPAEKK